MGRQRHEISCEVQTMRLTLDQYWSKHLRLIAERATCRRRQCGAIITDVRGAILSAGYNGVGSGLIHCGEVGALCDGSNRIPGDTGGENSPCFATHAEVNAIQTCHRIDLANVLYCTNFPCINCSKSIINTPIQKIVALEDYPGDRRGFTLLTSAWKSMTIRIGGETWVYQGREQISHYFAEDPIQ